MSKARKVNVVADNVIRVRNSERGTLDRCPQQWWWAWRDGLRPKETAKPLWFGTAIHEALAHYYAPGLKRRKDFIDKFRESADMEAEYMRVNVGSLDEDAFVEARTLGEVMLNGYVEQYGRDRDWDVIATEQTFSLRIPMYKGSDDTDSPILMQYLATLPDHFLLNGTFDGVYRDRRDKKIKLMEHKTAATISTGHLPMDNQAGTYWMVAQSVGRDQGWLGKGDNIREIMYNFLRKALPDPRPRDADGYYTNKPSKEQYQAALAASGFEPEVGVRGGVRWPTIAEMAGLADERGLVVLGDRSKSQPPMLFERHPVRKTTGQRRGQLERLQSEVLRMLMYRDGVLPLTKSPDRGHCGFCSFREMCELHESGAGWTTFRDAMYRADDPYKDHRKSAAA
jgi:hypothetical protein